MTKQVLSIEQMQHLQELGLDTSNASMVWGKYEGEEEYSHLLPRKKPRKTSRMMRNISQLQIYNGGTTMITFEEFADAYAEAVPKILAKMKYLERIGRDPFDENKANKATVQELIQYFKDK